MNSKVYLFLSFTLCLSLTGCAELNQKITQTHENIMMPIDERVHSAKTVSSDVKFYFQQKYDNAKNGLESIKTNLIENKLSRYVLDKDYILKNRENLVIWSGNLSYDYETIIKEKVKTLDPKGINNQQKFSILEDYFFEQALQNYKYDFSLKNPIPQNNQYITARENLKILNEYKTNLNDLQHNWELKLNDTKNQSASNALDALYGKPLLVNAKYSAEAKALAFEIKSQKQNFSKIAYIEIDGSTAKKIVDNVENAKINVYFIKSFSNNLELAGVNIIFMHDTYLATFKDTYFEKDQQLLISVNDKVDLATVDINYKVLPSKIAPPAWYGQASTVSEKLIGYGSSINEEDAKKAAYAEVSSTLELNILSNQQLHKSIEGGVISQTQDQNINIKSSAKDLKGIKISQREYKDGLWWVKAEYSVNK